MDSILYQFLRLNKCLLCITGQWFYQTKWEMIFISLIFVPTIIGQWILQGAGMYTALGANDIDAFMEGVAPFISSFMCICKFVNYIYNNGLMRNLLNVIQEDWRIYSKSQGDFEILCRNYAVAKKVTIGYAVCLYGTMTTFLLVPCMITVADTIGIYNFTGERPLMFRVEHFVDTDKYYYPLLIHSYFGTLGFVTIAVAIDSLVMLYVQHGCGMCEILGRKLEGFIEDNNLDIDVYVIKDQDGPYRDIKKCITLHKHIIQFARYVEEANSTSYLFQLGLILIGITFTEYQAVVKLQTPNVSLRYASFTICLTCVLLLVSWPGQQLLDHTDRIFQYTTIGNWYSSSINTRRLIRIMMLRSLTPMKLTAGKLYTLDLRNFSAVARTSFSYFTVLSSIQ